VILLKARRMLPAACLVALAVCGCDRARGRASHRPAPAVNAEAGYTAPPAASASAVVSGGRVEILGEAPPGAKVRLASPNGQALFADADTGGIWRIVVPPSAEVRLFGLSAPVAGRIVQAEGYLALAPGGRLVQLRAGSGAQCLRPLAPGLALLAADFDRKGVVVLSGRAAPGAQVAIAVDGRAKGSALAQADGRFMVAFNEPLAPGAHVLAASVGGARAEEPLDVAPAAPLAPGPFRAERADNGWRIDWLTPGGGVQSTVIYDRRAA
jgi:hypothetical protein